MPGGFGCWALGVSPRISGLGARPSAAQPSQHFIASQPPHACPPPLTPLSSRPRYPVFFAQDDVNSLAPPRFPQARLLGRPRPCAYVARPEPSLALRSGPDPLRHPSQHANADRHPPPPALPLSYCFLGCSVSVAARPAFAAVRNQLTGVPQFRAVPRLQGERPQLGQAGRGEMDRALMLALLSFAVRGYAAESGKFSRSLPHMNVGTIGHVDHG